MSGSVALSILAEPLNKRYIKKIRYFNQVIWLIKKVPYKIFLSFRKVIVPNIIVSIEPEVYVKMFVPYNHDQEGGYPATVRLKVPITEHDMRKSQIFGEFFREPHRQRDREFAKILLEKYAGKTLRFNHIVEGFYSDVEILD